MFFERERTALTAASVGICAASIPFLNFGVAMAAAMANDSGKLNAFESMLQWTVLVSAVLWVPAVALLAPALTFLAINTACHLLETALDKFCSCISHLCL